MSRWRALPRVSRGEVLPPAPVALPLRAALDFPGLDLAALVSVENQPVARLDFPGLDLATTLAMVGQPAARLDFPGLQMLTGPSPLLTFVGLQIDAQVRRPDPNAAFVFPGLDIFADRTSVGTYVNGYAARRRLAAAAQGDLPDETLTDLVLIVRHQPSSVLDLTALKGKAAGGLVESTAGWDIRLEVGPDNDDGSGGTKIEHKLVGYLAASGPAALVVKVPSWAIRTANLVLFVYYGKAGLAASEEGSPYGSALLVTGWVPGSLGADLSGHSRDCTVSGLTATTLNGLPGVGMVAASFAELVGPTFLNGQQVLTQVVRIQPTAAGVAANGSVLRVGGTASHTADFTLWHVAGASASGTDNAYSQGAGFGPSNPTSDGPDNSCDTSYSIITSLLDGITPTFPTVYKNEDKLATTDFGTLNPANGSLPVSATDVLRIGAGPPAATQNEAVIGSYGTVEMWPFLWTAGRVRISARSELFPLVLWALGGEDKRTVSPQAPVAVPTYGEPPIGASTDLDLATAAVDGETPRTVQLTAVDATGERGQCSATLVGGKARVTPIATATGTDRLPYTVTKGTRTQTGRARLVFPTVAPPTGTFYADPDLAGLTPLARVTGDSMFNTQVGGIDPGRNYILIAQGTQLGAHTISKAGTRAHPLVIMAETPNGLTSFGGRGGFQAQVKLTGGWIWLYRLGLGYDDGTTTTPAVELAQGGDDCFVTRCQVSSSTGVHADGGDGAGQRCRVGFNRFTGQNRRLEVIQANIRLQCTRTDASNPHGWHIYYNWFSQDQNSNDPSDDPPNTDPNTDSECIYVGDGIKNPNGDLDHPFEVMLRDTIVEYNYAASTRRRCFYAKHSPLFRFNHLVQVTNFDTFAPRTASGAVGQDGAHGISIRGPSNIGAEVKFNRIEGWSSNLVQSWEAEVWGNVCTHGTPWRLYPNEKRPPSDDKKPIMGTLGGHIAGNSGDIYVGYFRDDAGYLLGTKLGKSTGAPGHGKLVRLEKNSGTYYDADGHAMAFDGSGHPTGSHPNIIPADIVKSDTTAVDLSPAVPTLSSTITGPGSSRGAKWDGG